MQSSVTVTSCPEEPRSPTSPTSPTNPISPSIVMDTTASLTQQSSLATGPVPLPIIQQSINEPISSTTLTAHGVPLTGNMGIVQTNNTPTSVLLLPGGAASPPGGPTLSSSISSSNIGGSVSTTGLMISSSLSSDKLALNALEQSANADLLLLDSDEIGHGIPTPECLPQSRKHSMTQSKLAASPHLSTSSN